MKKLNKILFSMGRSHMLCTKVRMLTLVTLCVALCDLNAQRVDSTAMAATSTIPPYSEDLALEIGAPGNVIEINLRKGESFGGVLSKIGVESKTLVALEKALRPHSNMKKLQIGTRIVVHKDADGYITRLDLYGDGGTVLIVQPDDKGIYSAHVAHKTFSTVITKVSGITSQNANISKVAQVMGASSKIVANFEKLYDGTTNFRQIPFGSKFEILFERYFDQDGNFVRDGRIIYASLNTPKIKKRVYLMKDERGNDKYYNEAGNLLDGAMSLAHPLKINAAISSKYGMRKHPISGQWKMHKGVDFAAPAGSKIYATAEGKVSFIGYNKGYGNYIKIDHNGRYYTLYAHMRSFAPGLKIGQNVSQGQSIGFVGTTGASTGPHLHYEVIERYQNGQVKHADPMRRTHASHDPSFYHHDMNMFRNSIREIEMLLPTAPCALRLSGLEELRIIQGLAHECS